MSNLVKCVLFLVLGIWFQVTNQVYDIKLSDATFGDVSGYLTNWVGIVLMFRGVWYFLKAARSWLDAERDNDVYS